MPLLRGLNDERTFVPTEVSMTIDTRDFPEHPTSGIVLRGVGARYDDRTSGAELVQALRRRGRRLPADRRRARRPGAAWLVCRLGSRTPDTRCPSTCSRASAASNTLRSFTDYRFHDDNMLLANAELRLALMTHLDLAMFADAGNVASRAERSRSRTSGPTAAACASIRAATTFAMVDVAHGDEGWRFLFRLKDPLALSRVEQEEPLVPFVP